MTTLFTSNTSVSWSHGDYCLPKTDNYLLEFRQAENYPCWHCETERPKG